MAPVSNVVSISLNKISAVELAGYLYKEEALFTHKFSTHTSLYPAATYDAASDAGVVATRIGV